MEHRWGHRLSTNIPVRLRCLQSCDSGCRCLGCLENVSANGALIRTELGIRPAPNVVVETLAAPLGLQGRELPASIVRASSGEIAVEWMEFASTGVSAVMTETRWTAEEATASARCLLSAASASVRWPPLRPHNAHPSPSGESQALSDSGGVLPIDLPDVRLIRR